jgi:hypothetical protein
MNAQTDRTHEQRIVALEQLAIALASDLLAVVQRTRQVAGHVETLPQYLAALRERGEKATAGK